MNEDSKILVAGHQGLVGSAILRALHAAGFRNTFVRPRSAVDLRNQAAVEQWFADVRPELAVLAAARVGGFNANSPYPVHFIRDNLQIQTNFIDSAWRNGVKKLLFLGSSCIYPRLAEQPIREESLLTGALEPTNEWYAIAKIAGIKLCQVYRKQYGFDAIAAMRTNLYGPGDNFDVESSHVRPVLMRRFHQAKEAGLREVVVRGTGAPHQEFLNVDDLADVCLFLLRRYSDPEIINVGWGKEISIRELAELVASTVGHSGDIVFDSSRPDGAPRKYSTPAECRRWDGNPESRSRPGWSRRIVGFSRTAITRGERDGRRPTHERPGSLGATGAANSSRDCVDQFHPLGRPRRQSGVGPLSCREVRPAFARRSPKEAAAAAIVGP